MFQVGLGKKGNEEGGKEMSRLTYILVELDRIGVEEGEYEKSCRGYELDSLEGQDMRNK